MTAEQVKNMTKAYDMNKDVNQIYEDAGITPTTTSGNQLHTMPSIAEAPERTETGRTGIGKTQMYTSDNANVRVLQDLSARMRENQSHSLVALFDDPLPFHRAEGGSYALPLGVSLIVGLVAYRIYKMRRGKNGIRV